MIFDTHTHIYLPEFDTDRDEVVHRALANDIGRLMLPNVDLDTVDALHRTLDAYPALCIAAMGLHPTSVTEHYTEALDRTFELFDRYPYRAVGEIGLDLYWDKSHLHEQLDALEAQVRLATQRSLPVIIHCREAFEPIISLLGRLSHLGLRGVFHSFSGDIDTLSQIFALGDFYIGINGTVTFKKSTLREVLPAIPSDRLLLETDAPYLPPVPYRGKRNEPAYIVHVCRKVAELKGIAPEEVAAATSANACRMFGI